MKCINLLYTLLCLYFIIQPATAQTLFQERAREAGLEFHHHEAYLMGGGAAAFDVDKDGDEDVYVTGGTGPDALFLNDGTGNFTNESIKYGIMQITRNYTTTSVTTGDIDNDGLREIFVGTVGHNNTEGIYLENLLLRLNPSTGKFENIASSAGLKDKSFCMGGHFFDANMDGLLDLYVINYVEESGYVNSGGQLVGFDHQCGRNRLYINNGGLFFSEWSSVYGLINDGCGLAATSSDIDGDGDPDLLIANDFGEWIAPNALFQNNYPIASFTDISRHSGMDARMYGMGIAIGDYDEDLDMDYYITNIGRNHFYENQGNQSFYNIAANLHVEDTYAVDGETLTTGWGSFFADINNDTYLDLFVANGFVHSSLAIDGIRQQDRLFISNANYEFTEQSQQSGINFDGLSRGAIYADFNQDGKLDILTVTNHILTPGTVNFLQYYENQSADQNWVSFRLEGRAANRDTYGAKVLLYSNWRTFLREVTGGASHASQSSSILHFGLADITEVDSAQVFWPGGQPETIINPGINQVHHILQKVALEANDDEIPNFVTNKVDIDFEPATNVLTITHLGWQPYKADLLVTDIMGRVVIQKDLALAPNQAWKITLPVPTHPTLFLSLKDKNGVKSKKIIKSF